MGPQTRSSTASAVRAEIERQQSRRLGPGTDLGVDAVADVALASKVGFLPGLAAKSVAMAVREGSKSDFSASGQAMVYNEVVKNPGILLDEFGKAGRQVGQEVASWFLPIEKGLK